MVKYILGAIALGTVGYGVDKAFNNGEATDFVKDKIQDGLFKCEPIFDYMEEKLGTNEIKISKEEVENVPAYSLLVGSEKFSDSNFDLYTYKKSIRDEFLKKHGIKICSEDKIKKENIKDDLPNFPKKFVKDFANLLEALKMQSIANNNDEKYIKVLKELLTKKLVKDDVLNFKLIKSILRANTLINDNSIFMSMNMLFPGNGLVQAVAKSFYATNTQEIPKEKS